MTDASPADFDQDRYRRLVVFLLAIGITVLFLFVVKDFIMPLLLAGIFSGLLRPVYVRLRKLFGGRKALASVVTLLLTMILVGLPLLALIGVVAAQAASVSQTAIDWVESQMHYSDFGAARAALVDRFPFVEQFLPEETKIVEAIGTIAGNLGSFLMKSLSAVTSGAASFFLSAFVMFYAMFFFLIDGPALIRKIVFYLPLSKQDKVAVLDRFLQVTRATLKGSLVIGFIQGLLGGIGFHFAGIEGAAFWGTVMMVLSVIPGIGTPLVWCPAVAWLLIKGEVVPGLLLLAWCAAVVSSIDNLLRPLLVGKDANLPDLLILIGTLGGIFMFGAVGFIVGPIICALFITIWDIYGTVFPLEAGLDDRNPRAKGDDPTGGRGGGTNLTTSGEAPSEAV